MMAATLVGSLTASRIASAAAQKPAAAASSHRWALGLELYTLMLKPTDDLEAAFRQIAAIGYREVELPGTYERSASELRALFDKAGLACPAVHVSPRASKGAFDFDDPAKLEGDLRTIGARYAVASIPYLPDRVYDVLRHPPAGFDADAVAKLFTSLTVDDWKRAADFLNRQGEALSKQGLRLAHHNHGADFAPLAGGTNGFRILVERTDPRLVDFELDLGWAASAGQDIGALWKLVGERVRLVHLKDTKRPATKNVMDLASTDAGTGIVPWREVADLVAHARVEHMFVEHEEPFATTPMDAARNDYAFLTKLFNGSTDAKAKP
jgi:sugar phosphate isomerase/epimerase